MKTKLILLITVLALVGIGSCSEPPEPIESPFNAAGMISPGTKVRMECYKCGYSSECKDGGMSPIICPNCGNETELIFCL